MEPFFHLSPEFTDPQRLRRERDKARELRLTPWWRQKIQSGICAYCEKKVLPHELTMDHIVPLARGGASVKSNLVPACKPCNQAKKLETPAEALLRGLSAGQAEMPSVES